MRGGRDANCFADDGYDQGMDSGGGDMGGGDF